MGRSKKKISAEHTSRLARIELPPSQIPVVQSELESLLDFVGRIEQLDLDSVEPFFGIAIDANPMRTDRQETSCDRTDTLRNAPQTDGESFLVPPVFGKQES
ncbi:MAG: Asp-tRNA(Asn)/Glu-tRNA(Gln) amidotransferase subunit GatC [Mariniblastus sp.]|nr:Asp-tRNA(Asn)/Glu-tRNA(Gln) amidotransferase subunit GatC [Mariniblastus sp.]